MKGLNEIINQAIQTHSEKLLIYYANEYKCRPQSLISSFLKFDSIKMAATLIIFSCKKNGMLKELEGQKDFSEWVNKQQIEEKWKPVMEKFLLILWGVSKE